MLKSKARDGMLQEGGKEVLPGGLNREGWSLLTNAGGGEEEERTGGKAVEKRKERKDAERVKVVNDDGWLE